MKTTHPSLRGLASSLFLNVGLTQVAEKLDPVAGHQIKRTGAAAEVAALPCSPCTYSIRRR